MADIQVLTTYIYLRFKKLIKNKKESFRTLKNFWPRRPQRESDIGKILVSDSKPQKRPQRAHMLTKNVPSLVKSPSEERSSSTNHIIYFVRGICISTKMNRTIIIRRDFLHYIKKYNRYEKRHRNLPVHCSPAFLIKEGDIVVAGQCRYFIGYSYLDPCAKQ